MSTNGIEHLKNLSHDWWKSDDTIYTVACILDDYGCFNNTRHVIDYFEKPWKFQNEIDFLVKEFK